MEPGIKKRSYLLSFAFLLLLAGATYWMLLREYPLPELREAIDMADNWLLGLSVLCAAGFAVGESVCIYEILRSLKVPLRYASCFSCSLLGIYFAAITPSASGGQPAQVYYLRKKGVPVAQGTVAMLLLTVIYKAVLLLVGLPLALLEAPIVFIGLPYFRILFCFGILVNTVLIFGCLLLMFSKKIVYKLSGWLLWLLQKLRLQARSQKTREKLDRQLEEYHAAAEYLRDHRAVVGRVTVYTILQRFSMFSVAYCIYRAFGLNALSWTEVLAIQIATALAVDSLPLPGAVGAAEGVFLGLYRGIYGGTLLVPALLLTRGASFYLPALICGIFTASYAILGGFQKKRGKEL